MNVITWKPEGRASDRFFRRNDRMMKQVFKHVVTFSEASHYVADAVNKARKIYANDKSVVVRLGEAKQEPIQPRKAG